MQNTLKVKKRGFVWEMKHNHTLYLMCVPGLLLLLAFAYVPMFGIRMAFTQFNAYDGIFGSPYNGITNFTYFLGDNPYFWNAVIIPGLFYDLPVFCCFLQSRPARSLHPGDMPIYRQLSF